MSERIISADEATALIGSPDFFPPQTSRQTTEIPQTPTPEYSVFQDGGMEVPGALESAVIGMGRTGDKIVSGVSNIFADEDQRATLAQEQAEKDRAYGMLSQERPYSTMTGEIIPYFAAPLGVAAQTTGGAIKTLASPVTKGLLSLGARVQKSPLADAVLTGMGLGGITYSDDQEQQAIQAGAEGAAGDVIGRLLGRVVQPVQSRLSGQMEELMEWGKGMGYKLLPSVETGSIPLKQFEASLKSTPSTSGPMVEVAEANQSRHNRIALQSIGEDGDEISAEALGKAHAKISKEFGDLTKDEKVLLDYGEDGTILDAIDDNLSNMGIDSVDDIDGAQKVVDRVLNKLRDGDVISGTNYQILQSKMGNKTRALLASNVNSEIELGYVHAAIKEALDDAVEKGLGPEKLEAFKNARQKWRNKLFIESPGVVNTGSGDLSPAKLANVLNRRDKPGYLRGQDKSDLYQLGRFGQAFKDIADSGTATRSFVGNLQNQLGIGGVLVGGGLLGQQALRQAGLNIDPAYVGLLAGAPLATQGLFNVGARGYIKGGGWPLKSGLIPPITKDLPAAIGDATRQYLPGASLRSISGRATPLLGVPFMAEGLVGE